MASSAAIVDDDEGLKIVCKINSILEAVDPNIWYQLHLTGIDDIQPRVGHVLMPLANKKVLLLGGGQHEGALSEMWTIDLSHNAQIQKESGDEIKSQVTRCPTVEGMKARYEFLCAMQNLKSEETDEDHLETNTKIWIFGGADSKLTFNDVGFMQNGNWVESLANVEANGKIPDSRTQGGNTSLVVDFNDKQYLIVFGGGQVGMDAVPDGNLYLFDIEEQTWLIVNVKSDVPPVTQGHVITCFGTKVFLHGGLNGTSLHDNLYMIDIGPFCENRQSVSWIQLESTGVKPSGRAAHGIVKSPIEGSSSFFIFGGLGEYGCFNDLWEFNTKSLSWKQLGLIKGNANSFCPESSRPSERLGLAMTAVSFPTTTGKDFLPLSYLLVHGGINPQGEMYNDLWIKKLE